MNGQALHAELLSKLSAMSPSTSNGHLMMHHQLSPLPSMLSPDQYANNLSSGADEGGRQSTSPNNLNRFSLTNRAHACSQPQCSASFPTLDLLEKHEVVHATNATNVVSKSLLFISIFSSLSFSSHSSLYRVSQKKPLYKTECIKKLIKIKDTVLCVSLSLKSNRIMSLKKLRDYFNLVLNGGKKRR